MPDDAISDGEQDPSSAGPPEEPRGPALHPIEGRRLALLVALSLGFVALADWLFWNCPRGWTMGAYGLALTGTLLVWDRPTRPRRAVLVVTLALVALSLQCFEEPNSLTVGYSALGLATLAILGREGWSASAVTWARRWALLVATGWQAFFRDVAAWYRRRQARTDSTRSGVRFLGNWSIPILLGAVFLALFAMANPVMSTWLDEAWRKTHRLLEQLAERLPSGRRALMWTLVALAVWTLLRFRSGIATSWWADGTNGDIEWGGFPKPPLVVRCLLLFNVVFAFQTGLDLYYLWGGGELPNGVTYAQYAHRGAYPLLAAAILAALFVLAAFRAGPRDKSMHRARLLVYVWLLQSLFLIVSAAWRLRLYIDAYTLTRWRVAAAIWMLLVFCGVLWILVRIAAGRSNLWLININAITALLVLYVCCFVGFDGWIARYNVTHCQEVRGSGPEIDIAYLERLGPDTLPALRQLALEIKGSPKARSVHATIKRLRADLQADLASWRGWTWRRQRLLQIDFSKLLPDPEGSTVKQPA